MIEKAKTAFWFLQRPSFWPFMLELDVSIDGRRQTIRSTTFTRQMDDMVET